MIGGSRMTHKIFWCRFMPDFREALFIGNPLQSGSVFLRLWMHGTKRLCVEAGTDLFFETCSRLHTAIREDASMNLVAIDSFSPPGPSPIYRDRFQPR